MESYDHARKTPILHMQFDQESTHLLKSTYAHKFKKIHTVNRRNPIKYMRNPVSV